VTTEGDRVVRIAPDKQNPYSWRDFCSKGRTANEVVEHPQRLHQPMRRVGDRYEAATWEDAIEDIASRLTAIVERDCPDAVACYTGNPSYTSMGATVFARAFMDALGSGNRFDVASIDQNAYIVVTEAMYGVPVLPLGYDVDSCRCFLIIGANPAESAMGWISSVPDGWRRILRARQRGADLIVVDPRNTPTAQAADMHVEVRPGADWALLLGLVKVVLDEKWYDDDACRDLSGMDTLFTLVAEADLRDLAMRCDVAVAVIVDIARRFTAAPTAMCLTHTGTAISDGGTLAQWLSLVLNHLSGRVDAVGGRTYNPGYVDYATVMGRRRRRDPHVSRLRRRPAIDGFHSLAELADEITTPGTGQIRGLFLVAGNPVTTGAQGEKLARALADLDLLVSLDLVQRESHRHAHWLLPMAHWLEREDLSVFATAFLDEPFLQLGAPAVAPPPGVRREWEVFTALSLAMDLPLLRDPNLAETIAQRRRAAHDAGDPTLAFGPLAMEVDMLRAGSVTLEDLRANPHGVIFAERALGRFAAAVQTADGKVALAPTEFIEEARRRLTSPDAPLSEGFPLLLVSRRRIESMNSWLNDTPTVVRRMTGNQLEIHPLDADRAGIVDGTDVLVESPVAIVTAAAVVTEATRPGVVIAEHGWGSAVCDPFTVSVVRRGFNRNALVEDDALDPLSQVPRLNGQPVRVRRLEH